MLIEPFPFQKIGIEFLLKTERGLLADEQGCLSGNTKIKVARGRNGTGTREYTLKNLYNRFNTKWDKTVPTYIKAYDGKELKLHRVKKVVYSGVSFLWEIKTKKGYKIQATENHEFLSSLEGEYKTLKNLRIGSTVYVNGKQVIECTRCGKKKVYYYPSNTTRLVHPDKCSKCARFLGNQSKRTRSKQLPPGEIFDKYGYILVLSPDHPNADANGYVFKHVLEMSKKLKRALKYPQDVVHHLNGNIQDNRIENLELHSHTSHAKLHSVKNKRNLSHDKFGNKIYWEPEPDKIVSKKIMKIEDVYDVVMDDPHRNFVANGFVVHNCGKTLQVAGAVEKLIGDKINVLVICPASLCLLWEQEIYKCLGAKDISVLHLKTVKTAVELKSRLRFVIVSHNYIQKEHQVERLRKVKWHVIVNDECQATKNHKAKTTKGFYKICKSTTGKVWLLSGTVATRSAQDYYPPLTIIQPGKWGTYREFSEMFCNVEVDYWSGGSKFTGIREDKKPLLRKAFSKIMLRRLKKDVLPELPDKIISVLPVEVNAKIVAECLKLDTDVIRRFITVGGKIPEHIMRVSRSIGLGKVDAAVEYVMSIDEPLVVVCTHTDVLCSVGEKLKKQGKRVGYVSGAESRSNKQKAVDDFQAGKLDVIILNAEAGGRGYTLTRASRMLFVEFPWSAAVRNQCRDRIHRITQKECCQIIEMKAVRTIDEQICEALDEKEAMMKAVMNDK